MLLPTPAGFPRPAPLTNPAGRRPHWTFGVAAAAAVAFGLLAACTAPPREASTGAAAPAAAAPAALPAAPSLAPPAAMRVEGVPPLPAALLPRLQRYGDVAGHWFVDWHPRQREMLVAHRGAGQATAQLYRLRAPLGALEPLTDGADPVTQARWEPRQGRFILFVRSQRGDEAYQIFRLDPATRAAVQITPAGERHELGGFVESRGLAIVTSVPLDRTAAGGRRSEITTRLSLIDPLAPDSPGGRRVVAELPGVGWFGPEVSPDETRIAITRYIAATHSEAWVIDIASGQLRRVLPAAGDTTTRAAHFVGAWTADGRGLYVVSDRAGEFRELMQLEVASGALTRLTSHIPWDVEDGDLSPDKKTLALRINVDGHEQLRLLEAASPSVASATASSAASSAPPAAPPAAPPQGSAGTAFATATTASRERRLPPLPAGSVSALRWHPATGELALVTQSEQGPGRIHAFDPATGRHEPWTRPRTPDGLDLSQIPEQQIVRWTSFDGRTISGVLSLPPARFGGRRPVLMSMHGGPEGQSKLGWNGRLNYVLMELGVAIFEPNVRGSSGYGKTFLDLDNGRLREDSVKDMASAIDWTATHPRLDHRKVVVYGGSYGGYMALAAATRLPEKIAGAASAVGISNFVTFLENTESYRRDLRRAEYGDERDPAMREFLLAISPLTHADKVSKPLLVTQGRNDPRVPWTESEQIVRRLQQRGVPVWYLLADNEGHGFARRENADFALATLVRFLEETVLK